MTEPTQPRPPNIILIQTELLIKILSSVAEHNFNLGVNLGYRQGRRDQKAQKP